MLADLPDDLIVPVEETYEHGEVGCVGLAVRRRLERQRRGSELHHDWDKARPTPLREQQGTSPDRKSIGDRLEFERPQSRRFPRIDRDHSGVPHRKVALPRRDRQPGPFHPDVDSSESAVECRVGRRVPEEVVVAQVAINALECGTQVVGVVEEHAAGFLRQPPESHCRVAPEVVLVVLETSDEGTATRVRVRGVYADRRGLVHPVANPGLIALGTQTCGIDGVDAHVGTVRRVDDAEEQPVHRRGDGDPFREQDYALSPRESAHRADDRHQGVGGDVALLVAFELGEGLDHPGLHDRKVSRPSARLGRRTSRRLRGCGRRARRRRFPVGRSLLLLELLGVETWRAAAANRCERPAHGDPVACEGHEGSQRQVDAEDPDIVRHLFLGAEIVLGCLQRQTSSFRAEAVEDQRGDPWSRIHRCRRSNPPGRASGSLGRQGRG